jgi:hypothetical protein
VDFHIGIVADRWKSCCSKVLNVLAADEFIKLKIGTAKPWSQLIFYEDAVIFEKWECL